MNRKYFLQHREKQYRSSRWIPISIPALHLRPHSFSLAVAACSGLVKLLGLDLTMIRERQTLKQVGIFCLLGMVLLGIALFTPDAAQTDDTNFVAFARRTTWHHPLDWHAAWCSVKLILFSIGFFLIVDSLGTLLMKFEYRLLAVMVFLLHLLAALGVGAGGYYLLKALL